jgi:hypothetical protein
LPAESEATNKADRLEKRNKEKVERLAIYTSSFRYANYSYKLSSKGRRSGRRQHHYQKQQQQQQQQQQLDVITTQAENKQVGWWWWSMVGRGTPSVPGGIVPVRTRITNRT